MNKIYVKFFSYKRSMLHKILSWIERQSRIVLILFGFVTILLLLPPLFMNPAGQASMDPSGKVFNLQKKVGDHFSPRTHIQTAVLEANDGDALTAKVLSELFSNFQEIYAFKEENINIKRIVNSLRNHLLMLLILFIMMRSSLG